MRWRLRSSAKLGTSALLSLTRIALPPSIINGLEMAPRKGRHRYALAASAFDSFRAPSPTCLKAALRSTVNAHRCLRCDTVWRWFSGIFYSLVRGGHLSLFVAERRQNRRRAILQSRRTNLAHERHFLTTFRPEQAILFALVPIF